MSRARRGLPAVSVPPERVRLHALPRLPVAGIDQRQELGDDHRRRTPEVRPSEIERRDLHRHAASLAKLYPPGRRLGQHAERDLDEALDFSGVGDEGGLLVPGRDDRVEKIPADRNVQRREPPANDDTVRAEADLFRRFAKRGVLHAFPRLGSTPREGHLTAVRGEVRSAHRQEERRLGRHRIDEDEAGGGATRRSAPEKRAGGARPGSEARLGRLPRKMLEPDRREKSGDVRESHRARIANGCGLEVQSGMLAGFLLAAAATASSSVDTSRGEQPFIVYKGASASAPAKKAMVLVLSGEGGWRSFDDQIAGWLAGAGHWVGGIDCMKYFWKPQDDREALAADVRKYADALKRAAGEATDGRLVLAGYSFGADLAPWVGGAANRDPRIAALLMIGPDKIGSLEFRVSEMMGFVPKDHVFDTAGALAGAVGVPTLFVHGGSDKSSSAPELHAGFAGRKELIVIPGATHHLSGHEDELRRALTEGLGRLLAR